MSYTSPQSSIAPSCLSLDLVYRDANGLIIICMYCHRTHVPDSNQWDWVEAYAATPPVRASHGLCKACLDAETSKQELEKKPVGGDVQSIKNVIQYLAHQLWLQKRHTTGGVEWLVDGGLTAQLDELSRSDLVHMKRLLLENVLSIHQTSGT